MSDSSFDPYHKWLGIPAKDQPPNHYRLLGIEVYEADSDVIEAAAQRQISHLQTYAIGQNSERSQTLLNEVAAARNTLLNPERKLRYDQALLQSQASLATHPEKQDRPPTTSQRQQSRNRIPSVAKRRTRASGTRTTQFATWKRPVLAGSVLGASLLLIFVTYKLLPRDSPTNPVTTEQAAPKNRSSSRSDRAMAPVRQSESTCDARQRNTEPEASESLLNRFSAPSQLNPLQSAKGTSSSQKTQSDGRSLSNDRSPIPQSEAIAPPPAVAPFDSRKASAHQESWADHLGVPVESTNTIGMKLHLISAGTFPMGSDASQDDSEKPIHQVRISEPFLVGVHEVTQAQYEEVMGLNPSKMKGDQHPVEHVFWADAVAFCQKLSALPTEQQAGRVYRLPTEAEWEYACRAGTITENNFAEGESELDDHAWYEKNSAGKTHPVAEKLANAWGLHDMSGNVWEWCEDWYGLYSTGSSTDPNGPSSSEGRVSRGGCWNDIPWNCRSANRRWTHPTFRGNRSVGFRVAVTLSHTPEP